MPGFLRRPLYLFICCALAGMPAVHAEEASPEAVPGEAEVDAPAASAPEGADPSPVPPLRLDRKVDSLAPKPPGPAAPPVPGLPLQARPLKGDDGVPVFIIADRIEGRTEEVVEARGNAELRKIGSLLFADRLIYRPLEDEVEALGDVRLQQGGDELSGPHLRLKVSAQEGFFDDVDYRFKREVASRFYRPVRAVSTTVGTSASTGGAPLMMHVPAGYGLPTKVPPRRSTAGYGHADRIDFEGENQVRLTDATYSTCKPDDPDWYLKGEEFKLDYDREEGTVRHATLVFKETPIFYTPVGSFSLNHKRKSGFLTAHLAASTKNGFDLNLPYYANLAPNYDLTLFPRYMSKRGFQLGAETRYTDFNYGGRLRVEYLPTDAIENRPRHAYSFTHTHNLGQGLTARVNWNGVSDDHYYQDFSSRLLRTSQTQLPRQLSLNYTPDSWWSGNMRILRYQTLSPDPANPVSRPYFAEPQINFSGRLADLQKTDLSLFGQFTKFTHPTRTDGTRTVFYPQWSLPYITPSLTVIPKLGLHATKYALNRQDPGDPASISRVLPTFTLDSTVFMERDAQWFGRDHIQTLEPRLYYVYIPYRDQSRIPAFDTTVADFNFTQIFAENRYTGFDRINDANQLTAAVTTRMLDATTGVERFKALLGQRYYFRDQRVTLSTLNFTEARREDRASSSLAAFTGTVLPKTYVDAAWEYSHQDNRSERYSVGARYQPDLARVVSASYRYNRSILGQGQVDQIDVAGQWPISRQWYAVGRYNYSLRDKQLLEAIGGLEYNAGCWASRFVVQRLEALSGTANTTFFFQLELNDFASVGSNPIRLLRRTIPGYGKVNEMPDAGSLLTTE